MHYFCKTNITKFTAMNKSINIEKLSKLSTVDTLLSKKYGIAGEAAAPNLRVKPINYHSHFQFYS